MKAIPGYENYEISAFGHVLNKNTGKILKPYFNEYYYITLSKNGIQKDFRVHRLVALAWIDNPNDFPEVNHKYGNKLNNYFLNLEWCTSSMNRKHAYDTGLQNKTKEHCRRLGKRRVMEVSKRIIQYDYITGKYISEYRSTKEAARETGINQWDISNTANKKQKYTRGYVFVFASDLKPVKCSPCFTETLILKKAS